MKIYIEAIEDVKNKPEDYVGDFIQEEVTDTDKKAKDKIKLKEKSGKTYKYRKHFHYHEEDEPNKPCVVEDL
ncbi:MAG: hypothetical protein QQN41_00065 [Nitrosopumilus sp.]